MTLARVVLALAVVAHAPAQDPWKAELERRLAGLRPDVPSAYISLAEDLMDRADPAPGPARDADRGLAIGLAALAGAIDVAGTGRSAALFLSEHAVAEADRSRYAAVAMALDTGADAALDRAERRAAALGLMRAFGHYRRGEGAKAREALGIAGASALLDANLAVLAGGSVRFLADCDAMKGGALPAMSARQVEALHAVVSATLAGGPRRWGDAIACGGLAPLPEVDLSDPKALFGVDPRECLWRDGKWVRAAPAGPVR